ncbi:hypothetical protein TNCV_3251631 [Trichonephila clavipes]|nr:hypothetical protein TNCV_3251631 [Trichonephila clavipes]
MSGRGQRNSSRLRARCTLVVSRNFEHHTGDSTFWLGSTPVLWENTLEKQIVAALGKKGVSGICQERDHHILRAQRISGIFPAFEIRVVLPLNEKPLDSIFRPFTLPLPFRNNVSLPFGNGRNRTSYDRNMSIGNPWINPSFRSLLCRISFTGERDSAKDTHFRVAVRGGRRGRQEDGRQSRQGCGCIRHQEMAKIPRNNKCFFYIIAK